MSARVVAIFGPTGSGKTEVATQVAAALGTEVVNADPAQCYRGLPILTNQPGPQHDAVALHQLIAIWPMQHESTFVEFAALAHLAIDDLIDRRGSAVVCGGSGLYLQAALTNLPDPQRGGAPEHDPVARAQLEQQFAKAGGGPLHAELAQLDPAVAQRVHLNDRIRLVRALEVARSGGSISPAGGSHWDAPQRASTLLIGLDVERSVSRARIDARTAGMFDRGVLDEVEALAGTHAELADTVFSHTARKLHGLEDCLGVLRGDWEVARAIELMATRTRQYAKRQGTWARRWPGLVRIDVTAANIDATTTAVLDRHRGAAPSGR